MKAFTIFSAFSAILSSTTLVSAQSNPDPIGTIYDGHVPDSLYGSNYTYP